MPFRKPLVAVTSLLMVSVAAAAAVSAGETKALQLVNLSRTGKVSPFGAFRPSLSGDGRLVVFHSEAPDLVEGDHNQYSDIFLRDCAKGTLQRINLSKAGEELDEETFPGVISRDGQVIAYPGTEGRNRSEDEAGGIMLFDRRTQEAEMVCFSSMGSKANRGSDQPSLSGDGRFVAFRSEATNLVSDDTNRVADVFLRDRKAGTTERVSVSSQGEQADKASEGGAVSADGRFVAFSSRATQLVPGDTDELPDVFVWDRQTRRTELISVDEKGADQPVGGLPPQISADGRFVVFTSTNPRAFTEFHEVDPGVEVLVRDRLKGTTERVSVSSAGEAANARCKDTQAQISADGRWVLFTSKASNLVPEDRNTGPDLFLRDRLGRTTRRINVTAKGEELRGFPVPEVALSADGKFAAFTLWLHSRARNEPGEWFEMYVVDVSAVGGRSAGPLLPDYGSVRRER